MRTKQSILNISAGLGSQLLITILSFFSRTVFIHTLGLDYLGVNGLFTSILAMLTLAEAGIGSSIVYSLYKPVADNDKHTINALMQLYKKAYMVIALVVLLLGLGLMPFLHLFVKDTHVTHLHLIYLIFLINTVAPYLFQHKISFLNVYQRGYIITGIYSISSILSMLLKIGILQFTQNYILYLIIDSVITLTNGVIIFFLVDRIYPFLKEKTKTVLDTVVKSGIIKNIKAILLQNVGNYLIFGTDNIIISSFISVAAVGLYSNYNMLIDICRTFINQIFQNIYHSVGNLVAKETQDKIYSVYKVYWLVNFWLYSFLSIFLYVIAEPFIKLWLGSSFIMGKTVLIVLVIVFYEKGMRNSITTVKTTSGIFHEDRYAPLCQAVINLGFSIWLVQYWGIVGVFLGTLLSALAVPLWTTPYLVYKKIFNKPLRMYYVTYCFYVCIGLGACLVTSLISSLIIPDNLFKLTLIGMIAVIIPNFIYVAVFRKTEEFKYIWSIIQRLLGVLLEKIMKTSKT
jgi:O-antigen/teichoic acid export membrane protein